MDGYSQVAVRWEPKFLTAHRDEITAVVTSGRTGVDAALMSALPNLGAGYETTDVDGLRGRHRGRVDDRCDAAVFAADRYVRAGRWPVEGMYPLTRQVSNTRVGIIGLGRIGSAIALRLSVFGCTISYHNRHVVEGSPYTYVGSPVELARGVEVLIVAAAGGSGT